MAAAVLVLLLPSATAGLFVGRSGQAEVPAADSVDVIESTQTGQIGRMQGWPELWGRPGSPSRRPT